MTQKTIKSLVLFFAAALFVLGGCEKDELLDTNNTVDELMAQASSKSNCYYNQEYNMMVFQSEKELNEYITNLNIGETRRIAEGEFVSLSDILAEVMEAEAEKDNYFEILYMQEDLTVQQKDDIIKQAEERDPVNITTKYLQEGIIRQFESKESYGYELTSCAPYYAEVLNKEGMVMAGDTIFQYTNDKVKMLTDGDFKKIKLLKLTESNDKENNIELIDVASGGKSQIIFYSYNTKFEAYKKRISVQAFLNEYWSGNKKSYAYYLQFYCEEKNFWGNWKPETDAWVIVRDNLQVIRNGSTVLNHNETKVFDNHDCYSGSILVYSDSYSTLVRKFSRNPVRWTRSGGPSGFTNTATCTPYNW